MVVVGKIKKGAYFDSVTLMTVGKEITKMTGVIDAAVVMGSNENKAILVSSGLQTPEFAKASDTDLLIVVKTENAKTGAKVLKAVDELLTKSRKKVTANAEYCPKSLEGALNLLLPEANLALISVAGRYAANEAMKALESGLHVMLFSDNVPLTQEIALKKFARKKGLLVMGPDCGTAIINGIPLAFANVVNRGNIGIVAASGTGLQEVSSIISNEGSGISQAIGTGSRDVTREVGGIMFLAALKALAEDEKTKVILLLSKPPHKDVYERIKKVIKGIHKPVVSIFLGADSGKSGTASTLEEAALMAVSCAQDQNPEAVSRLLKSREDEIKQLAKQEAQKRKKGQKFVRGLFSGGTFCTEAQVVFKDMISDVYSNAPAANTKKLGDSLKSHNNTVIDFGADEFTTGRLHPMIDYSLRNKRILAEAADPDTAVILLDVVLGYGANSNPAAELSGVIRQACHHVAVVCSITGTDLDPQNKKQVKTTLQQAGALILPSNAAACKLSGYIIRFLQEKSKRIRKRGKR